MHAHSTYLRLCIASMAALTACSMASSPTAAAEATTPAPSDWEALAAEVDAFSAEWEDPFADILPVEPYVPPRWFGFFTLGTGTGYTENVLRDPNPLSAQLFWVEADAFIQVAAPGNSLLTAFAYAQWTRYDAAIDPAEESIALAEITWARPFERLTPSLRLNTFYGDQIYDDSLSMVGTPSSNRLRQFQPRLSLRLEWLATPAWQLNAEVFGMRARYGDSDLDFAALGAQLGALYTSPSTDLEVALDVQVLRESYEQEAARLPSGLSIANTLLRVNRLRVDPALRWQTPWQSLSLSFAPFIEWRDDNGGGYEDLLRFGAAARARLDLADFKFELSAHSARIHFAARTTGALASSPPLRESRAGANFSVTHPFLLKTDLRIEAAYQRFESRIVGEAWQDRTIKISLSKAF